MSGEDQPGETGPYVLRSLLADVPLSTDGASSLDTQITCVELWNGNLYIGTSSAELLHFVLIPSDGSDVSSQSTFILASRLQPPSSGDAKVGVQQVLILSRANKACVLCNNTLTFYSLPELSPAFGPTLVKNVSFIGGVDLNLEDDRPKTEVVMISVKTRIRLVKVGDEARLVKNIEFANSLRSARRGAFACVADHKSYALLDVDHQQKIPLFPISSEGTDSDATIGGKFEDISASSGATLEPERGHARSTSLGALVGGIGRRQASPRAQSAERSGLEEPGSLLRATSPDPSAIPSPEPEPNNKRLSLVEGQRALAYRPALKPHILSPTPREFFLTTGSLPSEPGVGMFVNLDGDVSRSTIEFDRYPKAIVADGRGAEEDSVHENQQADQEGYMLSVIAAEIEDGPDQILAQRWDVDTAIQPQTHHWIPLPATSTSQDSSHQNLHLAATKSESEVRVDELQTKLQLRRLLLFKIPESVKSADSRTNASIEQVAREIELFESQTDIPSRDGDAARVQEEEQFALRFNTVRCRVVLWSGSTIWWMVRNPLALRLDASLQSAGLTSNFDFDGFNHRKVLEVLNGIRGQEARTETESFSLQFIRHKASLLLLLNFLSAFTSPRARVVSDAEKTIVRDSLIESGLDPRVTVAMVPLFRSQVAEGKDGLWIFGGVQEIAEQYLNHSQDTTVSHKPEILDLFRHYLSAWRSKKGFGSVANARQVSQTVDLTLLMVLLELDSDRSQSRSVSETRAALYALVDQGIDGFDEAVELLERYSRLYVLSRLYQSRKLSKDVLGTWRRILEKDSDEYGEFAEGEIEMRKYLGRIRDEQLFREYGSWLARRNPPMGIQVFSDPQSRIQMQPSDIVDLLRKDAPGTVRDYLEHLVFEQNHSQYVNELITFYLESVTAVLQKSESARSMLSQSYSTYRALRAPKPTYQTFITENALDKPWWHHRLRLLQLLGGSHPSAAGYDVASILSRLEPFEQQLVPEMIILDGRQSRHPQALRLLVHGLGDYDTAINYCLLGGSSIVMPLKGQPRIEKPSQQEQSVLFTLLLKEFLFVEDVGERLEQSGALLERFGGWFDLDQVIELLPESWSVAIFSGFLVSAIRRLVHERSETLITKSLSGAENLGVASSLVACIESAGPNIEAVE
ncbi:MAG: hypothetical protein M1814_006472 [Vezdaea aestivalis]|nr:MAG: hypothetical protein M1814_006472 [Vezdaea aestivalis]